MSEDASHTPLWNEPLRNVTDFADRHPVFLFIVYLNLFIAGRYFLEVLGGTIAPFRYLGF